MRFSRLYLNRLLDSPTPHDTIVVIDVLRSFTSAAVALARGARAIYPVESISEAVTLHDRLPNALSVGAFGGGDPIPGFDFGNTPSALLQADVAGRDVVMSTAAGVRGLQRFSQGRQLFAASLVCARATARAIRATVAEDVCFIITGEWVDRDGDEDVACADYLEALLSGRPADSGIYAQRVRDSDFGRRFIAGTWPNLPVADLDLAADTDRYDFAMPVYHENGHLVIRAGR
ncbi:2-phosphosulfolactate phosphatase [Dechloromonas sp.]|uniref:2-phosphosulfolactate phosphatase n=1 Tax=Dechloromonas sp. TaxID=1917218 RepID=UPI00121FCCAD|nr:2-phosphosulfolactate phosphatase [Dechloromonas sp.]MBU3697288.1 2-phosphosulfolactate phosphatase [Dechloromonas sp.]TEX44419.1 MAG: 2-phosphosulfolactate phosphatase [Rhodocyclaceae bacterium]